MIRIFDFLFSLFGLLLLSPLILIIIILGLFDTGYPIFSQSRVGRQMRSFKLYKFRSMVISTHSVPTHLANSKDITKLGRILRMSKMDEILQLWNVLVGDMSLVGPRPNLFSQIDLIQERSIRSIYSVRPGITGLAQIKKIDMSTPKLLA